MNIEQLDNFSALFQHINPKDLKIILRFCKPIRLKKGQFLFYERSVGDSIYLIKSGKMTIETKGQHLTYLYRGDFLGEASILNRKPHSSSAYAEDFSELYALNMLKLHADYPKLYADLIINLNKLLSDRLHHMNVLASKSQKKEIVLLQNQVQTARFMTYLLVIMAFFIILRDIAEAIRFTESASTLNIRMTLVLALVFFIVMWKNGYSLRAMGFTWENSKQSVIESLILSFPVIAAIMLIKWILITYVPAFQGISLLHFYKNNEELLEVSVGYIVFAPIQEFIARGCLQSSLLQYVKKDHAAYAILMSNLIFCSFYTSFALSVAPLLFLLGLMWGWLYLRHQTLIGVSLSHALIGICLTWVIGFPTQLL